MAINNQFFSPLRAISPGVSYGRNSRGLTTLEWLLIVAAVAGLAALAVVLVQNVVDDTAEEISGNNARVTAAQVAAARITSDARAELPQSEDIIDAISATVAAAAQKGVNGEYGSKCNRLSITYSDASIGSRWWPATEATGDAVSKKGTLRNEASEPTGKIGDDDDEDGHSTPRPKKALCEVAVTD